MDQKRNTDTKIKKWGSREESSEGQKDIYLIVLVRKKSLNSAHTLITHKSLRSKGRNLS